MISKSRDAGTEAKSFHVPGISHRNHRVRGVSYHAQRTEESNSDREVHEWDIQNHEMWVFKQMQICQFSANLVSQGSFNWRAEVAASSNIKAAGIWRIGIPLLLECRKVSCGTRSVESLQTFAHGNTLHERGIGQGNGAVPF